MNNVVKNSKTSSKKSITAKQQAKSNLTKRKNPDWDNLDRGYRYLTQDMKLPHDQAIAVMGNVVEESQGNYKATQKNGNGKGLIQWDGREVPNGRYGQWGSIWASVAKPANVYDATTDTMKNYWAPWRGLKGDKIRQEFIKAPLKQKTQIYAESYLRPGKPRIADRQLSTMQLDSIYNPRIKNIIVQKQGGQIRKMQIAAGGPITRYETLPNIEVVGYRPIELKTYKPLHKEYPFTGHSSLNIPIDEDTAYTQGQYSPYVISVDKTSNSKDYNLITNNCADATLGALNYIFGTKEKPLLFTTPGDVRDYAINKLHGKVTRDKDRIDTILIPRNKNNAKKISKKALEWAKNKDENTIYEFEYKGGGKMNILEFLKKGSGIHIKKENRGKFTKYCHGKVTDECIRKAKASGNPTLVKRATFAQNARRWKHQEGGIINPTNEIEFYKNWINSRKNKLHENMKYQGDVDAEISRQINNISEYTYENTNSDKFIGETDHKNKVVRLTPNSLPTTLLHEVVHTAIRKNSPQIQKVKQLSQNQNIIDYDYLNGLWKKDPSRYSKDIKKITHYEKPNEYVPRLYEFRMENNLDPNKEYKEEEIVPLMQKSNIPSIREGYYNPKMFTKALNEVAYNNSSNNNKQLLAKKGGKAFVEGVNVLDSNPKMSKAASKLVKKRQQGGLLQFLNSDTGQAIGNTLISGISAGMQAKQLNNAINEYQNAAKARLKKILNGTSIKDYYGEALQTMNPEENLSQLVLQKRAYDLQQKDAQKKYNEEKEQSNQNLIKFQQLANESNQNNFSNVLQNGLGIISLLNKKKDPDNGAPSKTISNQVVANNFQNGNQFTGGTSMNNYQNYFNNTLTKPTI